MSTFVQQYPGSETASLAPLKEAMLDVWYDLQKVGRDEAGRRCDVALSKLAEVAGADWSAGIDDAVIPWKTALTALHLTDYFTADGITVITGLEPAVAGAATAAEQQAGAAFVNNGTARAYLIPGVVQARALDGLVTYLYHALGTGFLSLVTVTVS